ncbi:transcriptional regulator, partial [Bifidobacterium adolescentis]
DTTAEPPDPVTGLITKSDGTLVDPSTGGTVDPDDGSIHDATTGQYIGLADRYLNATVCAVPAKN